MFASKTLIAAAAFAAVLTGFVAASHAGRPVTNGVSVNGVSWNGMGWNGIKKNGVETNGWGWNGLKTNGLKANGVDSRGVEVEMAPTVVEIALPGGEIVALR
jgi:hypothetical protein